MVLASIRTSRLAAVAPARAGRAATVVLRAADAERSPLLERLGGPAAIKAAVDIFYGKVCSQPSFAAASTAAGAAAAAAKPDPGSLARARPVLKAPLAAKTAVLTACTPQLLSTSLHCRLVSGRPAGCAFNKHVAT